MGEKVHYFSGSACNYPWFASRAPDKNHHKWTHYTAGIRNDWHYRKIILYSTHSWPLTHVRKGWGRLPAIYLASSQLPISLGVETALTSLFRLLSISNAQYQVQDRVELRKTCTTMERTVAMIDYTPIAKDFELYQVYLSPFSNLSIFSEQ